MKTGLSLMFARRFWTDWYYFLFAFGGGGAVGCATLWEWDKEAYAMRGRSNMFKKDHERLKLSDPSRELWK